MAWLWLRWRQGAVPALLKKTVIVLLLVRFAVPVAMIGSDWTFKQFMQTDYNQHLSGIDANAKVLEGEAGLGEAQQNMAPASDANEHSFGWFRKMMDAPKYFETKMEKMKELAEQSITHMLKLIVIFLLQIMIILIALLWILYRMGVVMYRLA